MKHRFFVYLYALGASFIVGLGVFCVPFGAWHGACEVVRLVSGAQDVSGRGRVEDPQAIAALSYEIRRETENWYESSSPLSKAGIWPIKKAVELASLEVAEATQGTPDKVEEARRLLGRIAWLLRSVEPDRWQNNPLYRRICNNALTTPPKVGWVISLVILWHFATLLSFGVVVLHVQARLRTLYRKSPKPTPMGNGAAKVTAKRLAPNPRLTLTPGWKAYFARKLFHSQSHRSSLKPTQMFSSPVIRIITGTYWLTEACVPPGGEIQIGGAEDSEATLEIDVPPGEFIHVKPTALLGYATQAGGKPFTLLTGVFKSFWWGMGCNPPMLFKGPCKVYLRARALESVAAKNCEALPINQLLWFSLSKPPELVNSRPDADVGSLLNMTLFVKHDSEGDETLWVDRRILPGSLRLLGKLIHLVIFIPLIAWVVVAF